MPHAFHPRLINPPFDDPGLFIPFAFEKRALIFDLGDISALSTRDILKITHGFVTHTHMDHFVGFDRLLRLFLGRNREVHLFGPPGFQRNIEGKLAGYTWNLVKHYTNRFTLFTTEVHPSALKTTSYAGQTGFSPNPDTITRPFNGVLYEEPAFRVSGALLDHRIPCLGISLRERFHVNIRKEALESLGLAVGPWLSRFKQALFEGQPPDTSFAVSCESEPAGAKHFLLKDLADRIAMITAGRKYTYIADVGYTSTNIDRILKLAAHADHLFIEAAFLNADQELAARKSHLTARQAGHLAGRAGAKSFSIFHFSPRYLGKEDLLWQEAQAAYNSTHPDDSAPSAPS